MHRKTKHPQCAFLNFFGELALVDEGIHELLYLLKMQGVRTQFSCQGDYDHGAYVLIKTKTLWGLLWRICKSWLAGNYTKESKQLIRRFRKGYKEARITWYHGTSDPNVSIANGKDAYYCVEPTYTNGDGFRITFRWPPEDTETLCNMLLQTEPRRK